MTFSKEWTDEERLKIVALLASQIQADIPAGNYGACLKVTENGDPVEFRPNMQSIIEVVAAPAEWLEHQRESIEQYVLGALIEIGRTPEEFYNTSLTEERERAARSYPVIKF